MNRRQAKKRIQETIKHRYSVYLSYMLWKIHLQNFCYNPGVRQYATRKASKQRIKEKLLS